MANPSSTDSPVGREAVVARLVTAAATLFAISGPDGVSLRQIAAEAGVNYGLIHQYIGTKDDLLRLVFRSVSDAAADRFSASGDLDEALEQLINSGTDAPSRYVTMLAWAILQGRDAHALLGRSPALHALLELVDQRDHDPIDARRRVAMVAAMNLGWQLFGPFIASGVDLDGVDLDETRRALSRRLLAEP